MDKQINYVPLLPKEPPEDLVHWALEQGVLNKEYLIYRDGRRYHALEERWENCVEVVCSACGNSFTATKMRAGGCHNAYAPAPFGWWNELTGESVIAGESTICPYCEQGMTTQHIRNISYEIRQQSWVPVIYRLPVEGVKDRLLIVDWMIERDIDKWGNSRYWTHLYSAWVIEEKKIVRIMGNRRVMYAISMTRPEQRKTYRDLFGASDRIYPWDTKVMEGTTAENSKLDRYIEAGGTRLVAYLGLYIKHPQVENLLMQGLVPLVKELLEIECTSTQYRNAGGYAKLQDRVDWKEKQPAKMLNMNREELRIFRENGWGSKHLSAIAWVKGAEIPLNWPDGINDILAAGLGECSEIVKEQPKELFWKILRYKKKHGFSYGYLRDYWEMAARLKMDLADDQVKWPRDLKRAHDSAAERINAQKDAQINESFATRFRELEWLGWEHDSLMIRPCASMQELRTEGKELHHCVATYDTRYATGDTAILFIRRKDQPDVPYFTLELDEEKLIVRQNRGLRNCAKTDEVQEFENAWLDWAKKQASKRKKGKVSVA